MTILCAMLVGYLLWSNASLVTMADSHTVGVAPGGDYTVGIVITDSSSSGSTGSGNTPDSGLDGSGACHDSVGLEVECWNGFGAWNYSQQAHCAWVDVPFSSPQWNGRVDADGNPTGYFLTCHKPGMYDLPPSPIWVEDLPDTPPKLDSDPEAVVREAVASLELHPPTVGVTAFTYPDFEEHGLTWWVGAIAWLWVDASDGLQWGRHELSASLDSASVEATVEATSVTFDPGDGAGELVTCWSPGTPRSFHAHGTISDKSPSGCDYQYLTTTDDETGERYAVSATVTWMVTWQSAVLGQSGRFTLDIASVDNPSIYIGELIATRRVPR